MADTKVLLLPFDSWAYLKAKSQKERIGRETPKEKLSGIYQALRKKNGLVPVRGESLGGREDGKITTWSLADMREMLDAEGLTYVEDDGI